MVASAARASVRYPEHIIIVIFCSGGSIEGDTSYHLIHTYILKLVSTGESIGRLKVCLRCAFKYATWWNTLSVLDVWS